MVGCSDLGIGFGPIGSCTVNTGSMCGGGEPVSPKVKDPKRDTSLKSSRVATKPGCPRDVVTGLLRIMSLSFEWSP